MNKQERNYPTRMHEVLAALRDALKRAEGCEYCAEYPDAYYQSD